MTMHYIIQVHLTGPDGIGRTKIVRFTEDSLYRGLYGEACLYKLMYVK